MRAKLLILSGVLLLAALLAWSLTRNRDEQHIRRAFDKLLAACALEASETTLQAAGSARTIGAFFSEDVRVDTGSFELEVDSRERLVQMVFNIRTRFSRLTLHASDIELSIASDSAVLRCVVTARAELQGSPESETEPFELQWVKGPEGWTITRVEPIQSIRHPLHGSGRPPSGLDL